VNPIETITDKVAVLMRDDVDTDRDGLPDGAEDGNRNGRVDRGETDPLRARS
jgi:hypothetical protein